MCQFNLDSLKIVKSKSVSEFDSLFPKSGQCYIGGEDAKKYRISLYRLDTGKPLWQNTKPTDCKFLSYNSWRTVKPS
jgi:hypothetical protein